MPSTDPRLSIDLSNPTANNRIYFPEVGGELLLNDFENIGDEALGNLGLGTAASVDVGTAPGEIPVLDIDGLFPVGTIPPVDVSGAIAASVGTVTQGYSARLNDITTLFGAALNDQVIRKKSDGSGLEFATLTTGGSGGAVTTVFGRPGDVTAQAGDYAIYYQPINSNLTSIASLTTTAFGRSLLTQADDVAVRNLIGAIDLTSLSNTAPITYNSNTGAIGITAASGSAPGSMSSAHFIKLEGISAGATANSSDSTLLNRANHEGTQPASTITGLGTAAVVNVGTTDGTIPLLGVGGVISVDAIPTFTTVKISNFSADVISKRLDQFVAPAANVTWNNRRIINLADPVGAQDAATRNFVVTGYQPLDNDLTLIAGLTTAPYGRSLLTQPDAPTARTALELGTLSLQSASAVAITGGAIAGVNFTLLSTPGTAIGQVWRNADTVQFKDSANVTRTLLDAAGNLEGLANPATARTNLGLTIGTNVQANLSTASAGVTFNDQPISRYSSLIKVVSASTYTLLAADNGTAIEFTNGSGVTLTVPSGLPGGFTCSMEQVGAGQVTVSGATNRQGHTKSAGQRAVFGVRMTSTANVYTLFGDTAA